MVKNNPEDSENQSQTVTGTQNVIIFYYHIIIILRLYLLFLTNRLVGIVEEKRMKHVQDAILQDIVALFVSIKIGNNIIRYITIIFIN